MTMARLIALVVAGLTGASLTIPPSIWHVAGEGWGTPSADETSVYFVSKNHEVLAVEAESGKVRWRQMTGEPGPETTGFESIVAGSVVAMGDYNLIAFDRRNGTLRWRFEGVDGYAPGVYLGASANGMLLTGSPSGRIYAVDHETGTMRWSVDVSGGRRITAFYPATNGTVVVAGYTETAIPNQGGTVAVDLTAGKLLWKTAFPRPLDRTLETNWTGGPVLTSAVAIASSGDGNIHAFDLGTGDIQWSIPMVNDLPVGTLISPDRDMRPLALTGNTLIAGSLTGVVIAYDLTSRRERWRFDGHLSGSTVFKLTATDDTAYVPYFSGELVALDVRDGSERWRIGDWKVGYRWAPLVSRDRIYVSGTQSGFHAFAR